MNITNVFANITNGFHVLYSLIFEQMPEYAYRSANNSNVREQDFTKSNKPYTQSSVVPEQTSPTQSNTESHDHMSSDWIKISLNPILTIADVEELHNQLKQYLGKRVQLSGKNVQRIDTASLQLLLAFMLKADITVCWVDYSEYLCESARLLGISTPLGLPTEVHG
ncbi:STAS domain-containing protein [Candidatus Albibeggiatoa sp. nov. NOAA]|uniref:STAS domain-containing protein n=1 Tax=Candidatus Albibeggiatoa sp. nov. NOAA TaxID=3162724 RepID=UPI0032FAAFED|nr:STAS domain-containing protein [Thiotrichaceae bacterium]